MTIPVKTKSYLPIFVSVGVGILLGLLMLVTFFIFYTNNNEVVSESPSFPTNNNDYKIFKEYWSNQIEVTGGQNAYVFFKQTYRNTDASKQHELAHIFGAALYDTVGLEGVEVCDEDYSYGCFHELLTNAVLEGGTETVLEIDAYCKEGEFDCQHGLGHGLLATTGYTEEGLMEALEWCNSLGSVDPADGCYGGIFMEYNLRFQWGLTAMVRNYDERIGTTLCDEVPEYAQTACSFWSAQWFLSLSSDKAFTDSTQWIFDQCQKFNYPYQRLQCVNGLGYEMSANADNIENAVAICKSISESGTRSQQQCVMSSIAGYYSDLQTQPEALAMCSTQDILPASYCSEVLESMSGPRIGIVEIW